MPTVPYSPVPDVAASTAGTPGFNIQASPADFGAGIGAATAQLGQTLGRAADTAAGDVVSIQTVHNNVAIDNAFNQHQTNISNLFYGDPAHPEVPGYFGLHGQAAVDAWPATAQAMDASRTGIAAGLQNQPQQLGFDLASRRLNSVMTQELGRHYEQEFSRYAIDTQKASIDAASRAVANGYNDDELFQHNLYQALRAADNKSALQEGALRGTDAGDAVFDENRKQAVQTLYTARAVAIGNADPVAGAAFVERNADNFDAITRHRLTQEFRAGADRAAVAGGISQEMGRPVAPPPAGGDIYSAIVGQEGSGDDAVSPKGATGRYQITPGTFAQYARPGESIVRKADNEAVGHRIIDDLRARFGDDPARVAVGYFSGPGNVAPAGSATPWIDDTDDGTPGHPGTKVSTYVAGVLARLGQSAHAPVYTAGSPAGLLTAGNIDIANRPVVHNDDGSISTVRSITVGTDGGQAVVLPTVIDGKVVSNDEAVAHWRSTGEQLGTFDTEANANAYAQSLHEQQATQYAQPATTSPTDPFGAEYARMQQARTHAAALFPARPDLQKQMVDGVWQEIQQTNVLQAKYEAEQLKAKRDAEEKAGADIYQQIMRDPAGFDPTTIDKNDGLDTAHKEHFRALALQMLLRAQGKGEPLAAVSHQTTTELNRRLTLPDGDPNKITDMRPIDDAFNAGNLTTSNYGFLRQQFLDKRTDEGQRLGVTEQQFLTAVKPSIEKSNPLMGTLDMTGGSLYFQLQQDIAGKVAEYRKAGKNPFDLFNPAKPDYLGRPEAMEQYQRSIPESMDSYLARMKRQVPAASPVPTTASAPPPAAPPPAAQPAGAAASGAGLWEQPDMRGLLAPRAAPPPPAPRKSLDEIFGRMPPRAAPPPPAPAAAPQPALPIGLPVGGTVPARQ